MSDIQPTGPAPGGGYERSDFRLRPVLVFGVLLTVTVALVLVLTAGMLDYFARRQPLQRAPAPAPPPVAMRSGPGEPILQVDGIRDYRSFREAEDRLLTSYGWADPEGGHVRIPIAAAMELLLARGLPAAERPAPSRRTRP